MNSKKENMSRSAGTQGLTPDEKVPGTDRVLVAMSGGVDSSVAAWLLKQEGMEVLGITFQLLDEQETALPLPEGHNGFLPATKRALEVCRKLDIPLHCTNLEESFRKRVIEPFLAEYTAGRTPNPCVRCNVRIKWNSLLDLAEKFCCRYVATGHYARTMEIRGRRILRRGLDREKDQSYALYMLGQPALSRTLFPLGEMTKQEVRRLAEKASLPSWNLPESQDICFVPQGGVRAFLSSRLAAEPGPVLDLEGNRMGTHKGLPFYTVGQRKGLGIPFAKPIYVIEKKAGENSLVVGPREALCKKTFSVEKVNWVSMPPPSQGTRLEAEVELRYRTTPIPAEIHVLESRSAHIHLPYHEQAVAPGQSAVWYQGEVLLGGGIIQG